MQRIINIGKRVPIVLAFLFNEKCLLKCRLESVAAKLIGSV
jgi:hypothetical protein